MKKTSYYELNVGCIQSIIPTFFFRYTEKLSSYNYKINTTKNKQTNNKQTNIEQLDYHMSMYSTKRHFSDTRISRMSIIGD